MNPLLENSTLEFEAIDFSKIEPKHFIPALDEAIKETKLKLEDIKKVQEPNFENVILAEETSGDRLGMVVNIFFALHSAHCTDEINGIAEEFNSKLTNLHSDINLDPELFAKVKAVYDAQEELGIKGEEAVVLESSYLQFTRNGALLDEDGKKRLREIDQELSKLSLNFSEHVRKANANSLLVVEDEKDVEGMPEGVLEAAKELASSKGHEGKWAFNFDFPSYLPFMQYCPNRELRKKMWQDNSSKNLAGEYDNRDVILNTLKLRDERAKLLGYKDHPSFILERRMAKDPKTVLSFIDEIIEKAMPKAKEDFTRLKNLKKELAGDDDFRAYDTQMYSEILKKKELNFDDEVLRPYFKLENVLDGVFKIANKLYGLKFIERNNLPKYHEDVKVYEVRDESDEYVGLYYGDFFPRPEKRPGAWMTVFREAGYQFGEVKRPFVTNVCNFTKPTASKPSLLTLDEVLTLFHEFGHGLHGLLAKSKYKSVAGTNVFWDFVELPSQIMENWVMEKECLDIFAKHYETGETMPGELVEKIKESNKFLEGLATLRQMSFSKLDMDWHLADPNTISDVEEFEKNSMHDVNLYPKESNSAMSTSFGHIFAGGYSSGYYSYKWAEVLDADAFSLFQEKGIFNREVAKSFKENILERGGSEDPMELFKKFRGREPSTDALLERAGLS